MRARGLGRARGARRPKLVRALLWGGVTVVVVAVGLAGVLVVLYSRADTTTVGRMAFANPLRIPLLLEPRLERDGDRGFDLIATDGGLLGAPVPLTRIQLSPGERVEIIARFEPGERAVLRSFEPDLGMNGFQARFAGGDDRFDVLQVRAGGSLRPVRPPPDRLGELEGLREADAVRTRTFDLDGSSRINGRRMDSGRADHTVVVGTTEVWDVRNKSGTIHNFHIHDVQFRLLAYAGGPPPPRLSGWKDTVFIPPGGSARLVMRFSDYADPTMPHMFHCHVLAHEDRGMMGQFVVVEPGQVPALRVEPPNQPGKPAHHR